MTEYAFNMGNIPSHMREGMRNYIEHGIPPGDFLRAVLENDLASAFERADSINSGRIRDYVVFLYNHAPSECWGSKANFAAWIEKRGLLGQQAPDQLKESC